VTITIEAIYENGILKLERPLPLQEHEKVQVTVVRHLSLAEQCYGLIGWKGDADTFDRIVAETEEAEALP
jgi:predicted DNA-binding antitoxin AbrB/MazE fold protein